MAAVNPNAIKDLMHLAAQFPGHNLDETYLLIEQVESGLQPPEIPDGAAFAHMNVQAKKFQDLTWWIVRPYAGPECVSLLKEETRVRDVLIKSLAYQSELRTRTALAASVKIRKLQGDIAALTTERNAKQTKIEQLEKEMAELNSDKTKLTNDKAIVDAQLASKQQELETIRKDFAAITREKELILKELQEYEHRLSRLEKVQQTACLQIQELQSQVESGQDAIEKFRKRAEKAEQERDTLSEERTKVEVSHSQKISDKNNTIKHLENLNRNIIIVLAIIGIAVAIFETFRPSAQCEI